MPGEGHPFFGTRQVTGAPLYLVEVEARSRIATKYQNYATISRLGVPFAIGRCVQRIPLGGVADTYKSDSRLKPSGIQR